MPDDPAPSDPTSPGDRRAVPIDDVRKAHGADLRAVPIEEVRRAQGQQKVAVQRSKVSGTKAFRRTRADRVWGAAGVVLVLIGAWMVFNWVPPVEVPPSVGVEWPESTQFIENQTVTVPRGQPVYAHPIRIDAPNVTRVAVTVSWVDEVGDQDIEWDIVSLNLTGPEGSGIVLHAQDQGDNVEGTLVPLTAARVAPKPDVRSVPARDVDEAARLLGDLTNRTGTGEWTLEIWLVSVGDDFSTNNARIASGGQCPEQGIPQVCTYDPGQTLMVGVEYSTYRHQFRED